MKKFLFIFCLMFLVVAFTACLNADAITSKPTTTSPSETHPNTTDTSIFVEGPEGMTYLIDGGRVAESGTHEQLMAQNGIYADMYNRQLLEKMKKEEFAL